MTMQMKSNLILPKDETPDYQTLYQDLQTQHQFMLSQISHEIRNPVTLINSFLQLLESHHPELTKDCYWQKIMENMDFLRLLLEELSLFNNSCKLHTQEMNLFHVFRDMINSVTPIYEKLGISVVLKKKTAIPMISADQTKLQQLILNLLRNAAEAIGTQGVITCSLRSNGERITMTVKDNGPGIPNEYHKDLFEPFVTHKQEGTGLGLAICKRIVTAHKGSISFTSALGAGTEFTIQLPVQ